MVGRVARAMAALDWGDVDKDDSYFRYARAAISEMRDPSAAQLAAAEEIVVGYDDFACGDGNIYLAYPEYYDKARRVWQSLIDAALKEEPKQ